jgi:hypothetical protein
MVLQIQNTHTILTKTKLNTMCIIKLGNIVEGLIEVITLGWGKDLAGWIASKLGYASCGCEERKIWLNELCGCKTGIKL